MEPHLPIKIFFKNLNYGASMFKMYTHPLCRCRQPWGNGSLPAVTVQQWYVFTCCIHTLHIYIYYMYKLLYCESPCTQANWKKKEPYSLALRLDMQVTMCISPMFPGFIRPPCELSENFAGTDTFCKIFHHIFCVPTSSKNSAPLIFRYPRFQFDFSALTS